MDEPMLNECNGSEMEWDSDEKTSSLLKSVEKRNSNNESCANKNTRKKMKISDIYQFGNYDRYYGYRNTEGHTDPRLEAFRLCERLFVNKDVLDIGCNIGHITYSVARDFGAKSVLGIDIDNKLIRIARKNVRYYCCTTSPAVTDLLENCNITSSQPSVNGTGNKLSFPNNISFLHGNYVPYDDDILSREEPKYDVILCLSVTKWIQLNWGDEGLIRTFKKIFIQLRPGGVFMLEAQPLESYSKKKLSAKFRQNSQKIRLLPQMFDEYLLSEIGFKFCEMLEVPSRPVKGFQRPIKLFFKA